MCFCDEHSQLRIREHLTHKQVLLNFSNYVFFVFIRTDLVIYFRMNSISPKKYQDILMLITVGEGTISPLIVWTQTSVSFCVDWYARFSPFVWSTVHFSAQ